MLLTEDEAKERWCPFARTVEKYDPGSTYARNRVVTNIDDDNGPNALSDQLVGCQCIASQCMTWRWQPLQADQPFMDAVKKRMDDAKDKHPAAVKYVRANLAEFGLPDKPFRGYCGLAGKPEA